MFQVNRLIAKVGFPTAALGPPLTKSATGTSKMLSPVRRPRAGFTISPWTEGSDTYLCYVTGLVNIVE